MKKITLWLVLFFSVLTIGAQNVRKVQLNPNGSLDQSAIMDLQTLAAEPETENTFSLSYYGKKVKPNWYGLGLGAPCDLHAAIFIPEAIAKNFIGRKLTTIKIGMKTLTSTSNYSVWVRENLDENPITIQPCNVPENPRRLFPVTLSTPYEINGKGFYIGYSLTVGVCQNPDHYYPIGVDLNLDQRYGNIQMINDEGWIDYGMEGGLGTLMLEGVCEGEIHLNNVDLTAAGENTCVKGDEFLMPISFTNVGKEDIKSLTVNYTIGNEATKTASVELPSAVNFMDSGSAQIPMIADGNIAANTVKMEVTHVNGKPDNATENNSCDGQVVILSKSTKHKAVIEELTGTWCPYCPRGHYSMDLIRKEFPHDVIIIEGHFQDTFMVKDYYPYLDRYVGRAPKCELNRNGIIDPYYGSTYMKKPGTFGTPLGIFDDIKAELTRACEADINLDAQIEGKTIKFNTDVTFFTNIDQCDYKLAFFVVEDSLIAEQLNYYHDEEPYPTLEHLKELPRLITDQVHNNVARSVSNPLGMEGALTGEIKDGQSKTHVFSVEAMDSIANVNNARAIVLLLNKDGRIVNAAQDFLGVPPTGIQQVENSAIEPVIEVTDGSLSVKAEGTFVAEVYSVDGKKVAGQKFNNDLKMPLNGLKGVYVVRLTQTNSTWVKKVIL